MSKILGKTLTNKMLDQFTARESTVVLATISEDGFPNTTPIHLITARDETSLILGVARIHKAFENISKHNKCMISLCEKNDLNISLKGFAHVIMESLESNKAMSAVQFDISEIKSDSTHSETISGIRYRVKTERGQKFIDEVFSELEEF